MDWQWDSSPFNSFRDKYIKKTDDVEADSDSIALLQTRITTVDTEEA
jgi:hypothetical protein